MKLAYPFLLLVSIGCSAFGQVGAEATIPSEADRENHYQIMFDSSVDRVSSWVAPVFAMELPKAPIVLVVTETEFREKAGTHAEQPDLARTVSWYSPLSHEILVDVVAFERYASKIVDAGFFEEDAVSLVLTHQLAIAMQHAKLESIGNLQKDDVHSKAQAMLCRAFASLLETQTAKSLGGAELEGFILHAQAQSLSPQGRAMTIAVGYLREIARKDDLGSAWSTVIAPPQDISQIIQDVLAGKAPAGAVLIEIRSVLGEGDWMPVVRSGLAPSIGQAWDWLSPEDKAGLQAGSVDAYLATMIDAAGGVPRVISVSVLAYETAQQAEDAAIYFEKALPLLAMRFDYTIEGEKRDSTPVVSEITPAWKLVHGEHSLPSGKPAFGFMATRVLGPRILLVNGVATPGAPEEIPSLLEVVTRVCQPSVSATPQTEE
jgi:hypothetical protein